jgi:hypothetical protein
MTTQQYNYFAISNNGNADYYVSKPKLEDHQLVVQGSFYPDPTCNIWSDRGPNIAGRVFVLKNEPVGRKIHWFNPRWGWDRCTDPSEVPAGHTWALTPEHCPEWVIDYLPQQVA